MNSTIFRIVLFLSLVSIFSANALNCDFCPEPGMLDGDDALCNKLLDLARSGNLYNNQDECDFNIPILAKRCKCNAPAPPRHEPCDPCAAADSTNSDIHDHASSTFQFPGGKLIIHENKYSCAEMLYSARNGGLHSSNCEALSASKVGSICGRCTKTEMCGIDESLCRSNQILVASNPQNFPEATNLWSTALSCKDLIEGARNGNLLSETECTTLKNSVRAAFMPGTVGVGTIDLTSCGLQCNYDESSRSEKSSLLQIQTGDDLMGRTENEDMSLEEQSKKKSAGNGTENCLRCDFENDTAFYLYKDFGQAGITFFEALSAPDHRARCKEGDSVCDPKEPLYPDLDNCHLADITTFDSIIGVQAVIPPKKAAYVAVYKDTVAQFEDAKGCIESLPDFECLAENYRLNLTYGNGEKDDDLTQFGMDSDDSSDSISCPELKEGWFNYGSDVAIPSNIWKDGQLSYCAVGPIQNAGAVWPVQPNGDNYGDMRDVNSGWKLPGAVYKCCKSLNVCSVSASEK